MKFRQTTLESWLEDAKTIQPDEEIWFYLKENQVAPTYAQMIDDLRTIPDLDPRVRVYKHGDRIDIFLQADDAERARFDERSKLVKYKSTDGSVTEYVCGFSRKILP